MKLSITIDSEHQSDKIVSHIQTVYFAACKEIEEKLLLSAPNNVNVIVCNDGKEINAVAGHDLPSWVLGVAISSRNIILINRQNLGILSNNLSSVLKHEVCHLYLGKWERSAKLNLPQWFNEGVCEWISGRLHFGHANQIFESAVWDQIIPFSHLENGFPLDADKAALAYIQSRDMIDYIASEYGKGSISQIMYFFEKTKNFSVAVDEATGFYLEELEKHWIKSITPSFKWFWRFTQLFSLFTIMAILVFWAYMKQQKKKRKLIEQWEEEDASYENTGY